MMLQRRERGEAMSQGDFEAAEALLRSGFPASSLYRVLEETSDLILVEVPGAEALESWQRLRDLVPETRRWPILAGDIDEVAQVLDPIGPGFDPAVVLAASREIDPVQWGTELRESDPDLYDPPRDEPEVRERVFRQTGPRRQITLHLDIQKGRPVDRVGVVLVPTEKSWEAPAYLNYGGWHECPEPAVHVAFLRRWHEIYGAEVVSIGPDAMELSVDRPVSDREAALALADEQFLYSYDIVAQGTETLDRLAAHLLQATVWYFWWD
jgi:hypothetical protein